MSDSFFDVPAGYREADLEMAALEARGRIVSRRFRGFTDEDLSQLASGNTVEAVRWYGPEGHRHSYLVRVRCADEDEYGMILAYTVDRERWHPTAKAARVDWQARFATRRA